MDRITQKPKIATIWLDGCSGCHMSLLDMDSAIVELEPKINLVYGPLVDAQAFPDNVDVTLVEGAISSDDDLEKIRNIREKTRVLVALGDCAVTGNVPAMRNGTPVEGLLQRIYIEGVEEGKVIPSHEVPALLKQVRPLREVVKVDFWLPGCPPSAKSILGLITDLLEGREPESQTVKFG